MRLFNLLPVPHLVFKVDSLKGNLIGAANAFVIRIEKEHDKESVYRHELEHVKQWYMTLGMHGLIYLLFRPYRQWCEVQAYKKSIEYGRTLESAAKGLMDESYRLDLTYEEALELLR